VLIFVVATAAATLSRTVRASALLPACDTVRHEVVALIGSCADLPSPPAWSFDALLRQATSLKAPDQGLLYHLAILLDDRHCPGRCGELEAGLHPHVVDCVSVRAAKQGDLEADLDLWTQSSPKDTLNRPDVVPYLTHAKHACASNFWVLEPDVAFFGDWASLLRKYAQRPVDLIAAEEPYEYDVDAAGQPQHQPGWVNPALNGSSAINTLREGGYRAVYKGLNFITRFSPRLVRAVAAAKHRGVTAYGELLWPSTCRAELHNCSWSAFDASDVGSPFHCCPTCDTVATSRRAVRSHLIEGSLPPTGLLHPVKWAAFESSKGWVAYQAATRISHAKFGHCNRTKVVVRERPAGRLADTRLVAAEDEAEKVGVDPEASLAARLHGCPSIFLDVGANIGMHARFLFEPHLYPNSSYISIFDRYFGSTRDGVCAVEIEPNPAQNPRLQALAASYATRNWRVFNAAVGASSERGTLPFYVNADAVGGATHEEWSASFVPQGNSSERVDVPTIDFARFVNLLPKDATVVLKMDIEGGEFSVLPQMIARGALCNRVDSITVEFHPHLAPFDFANSTLSLATRREAESVAATLKSLVRDSAASCRTRKLSDLDDESYLHDRSEEQRLNPTPS